MPFTPELNTPIEYLKGVGPARAEALRKEAGIFTINDLIHYFPFRYIDKTRIYKINEIQSDTVYIQVKGRVSNLSEAGEKHHKRLTGMLSDDSGSVELVWFKGLTWIKKYIIPGQEYLVYGKPTIFKGHFNLVHPEMISMQDVREGESLMKFQPVYSSTEKLDAKGLDSRGIMRLQKEALRMVLNQVTEFLPHTLTSSLKLLPRKEAIQNVHFPDGTVKLEQARFRLKFEELLLIQLELLKHKWNRNTYKSGHIFHTIGKNFNDFYEKILPFKLTEAQKKVIREIRTDMKSGVQMNRLLQGDVGSGKTIVALMSMLIAVDNGMQACIMAPTEILAMQHYSTIQPMMEKLGITVGLLTGSSKTAERRLLDTGLKDGSVQILIGTHALIEDMVQFNNLGFVVIDEQHRFGVAQRAKLWTKNEMPPHVLVMTATPIPRTLAMTLYGDLDNSVIDEMPPGRKPVFTSHYFETKRLLLNGFLKQKIQEGRQVYIVYPLIEESEKMDYQNLMAGYDNICKDFPKPEYQVGILHGKMKAEEKDTEMKRFKKGQINILVSTTVIEVGVDVPNASVMVIESAERFGLSQLHQLRGRVGRGAEQSYCILMTGYKLTEDAKTRMATMVRTSNGFEIAEVDLKLRGPGDLAGTQQSGLLNLRIANIVTDQQILKISRITAQKLIEEDPLLDSPENILLKNHINESRKGKFNWSEIS